MQRKTEPKKKRIMSIVPKSYPACLLNSVSDTCYALHCLHDHSSYHKNKTKST